MCSPIHRKSFHLCVQLGIASFHHQIVDRSLNEK
jgi:hypothetical protein